MRESRRDRDRDREKKERGRERAWRGTGPTDTAPEERSGRGRGGEPWKSNRSQASNPHHQPRATITERAGPEQGLGLGESRWPLGHGA